MIAAAAVLPAGCDAITDHPEDPAAEPAMPILRDGELRFEGGNRVAEIELGNRTRLHFVELEAGNIGLLEEQPPGAGGNSSIRALPRDASIADVFFAFSEPGTEIPEQLLVVSALSGGLGGQGWARVLVDRPAAQTQTALLEPASCNDATFASVVNSFGYADRGTPDLRLNKVPRSSGFFQRADLAPGNGLSYDFYEYVVGGSAGSIWSNVDRYVTRVALCAIDTYEPANPQGLAHPSIDFQGYQNAHMGPVARTMFRKPGDAVWQVAAVKDFAASEVGHVFSWHFFSGLDWDWRTDIYWAGADDEFDIGHALADL